MFLGQYDFLMFLEEVGYAHQGCIFFIKNTVKTVILWKLFQFKITVFYFNIFYNNTLLI